MSMTGEFGVHMVLAVVRHVTRDWPGIHCAFVQPFAEVPIEMAATAS